MVEQLLAMDRIDSIKSFVRAVETGSFSAVARDLGTTQPAVSKQIAALEAYLDTQLIIRSTRKLTLTEAGDRFYTQAQNVLAALAEAESSVGQRQQPSGVLRVSCPVSFGQLQVMPRMKQFLERYPKIQLKLSMSDHFVNLVETGVDLAIRIGHVPESNLKVQQLGGARRVVVASTTYLESRTEPQTPKDLMQHNCLIYQPSGSVWHFQTSTGKPVSVEVSGNFQVDNSMAIRIAVLQDMGIAFVPVWLLGDLMHSPDVSILLSNFQAQSLPIQAVCRQGKFVSAKVRCFIDYLGQEFERDSLVANCKKNE